MLIILDILFIDLAFSVVLSFALDLLFVLDLYRRSWT